MWSAEACVVRCKVVAVDLRQQVLADWLAYQGAQFVRGPGPASSFLVSEVTDAPSCPAPAAPTDPGGLPRRRHLRGHCPSRPCQRAHHPLPLPALPEAGAGRPEAGLRPLWPPRLALCRSPAGAGAGLQTGAPPLGRRLHPPPVSPPVSRRAPPRRADAADVVCGRRAATGARQGAARRAKGGPGGARGVADGCQRTDAPG